LGKHSNISFRIIGRLLLVPLHQITRESGRHLWQSAADANEFQFRMDKNIPMDEIRKLEICLAGETGTDAKGRRQIADEGER
jgi:hypothetical protein